MRIITPFTTSRSVASDFWRDMDRMFDDFSVTAPAYDEREYAVASEVIESDQHFMLSVDLPGLKKEDIKIELQENTLTVSGERKREREFDEKNGRSNRIEKFYGAFKRSYTLPQQIDASKIEAQYQDGVLELYLPKAQSSQPRKIEVQSGKPGFFDKLLNGKKNTPETTPTEKI